MQGRTFVMTNATMQGIMQHLAMQQAGLERIVSVVDEDLHKVGVMEQGYSSKP